MDEIQVEGSQSDSSDCVIIEHPNIVEKKIYNTISIPVNDHGDDISKFNQDIITLGQLNMHFKLDVLSPTSKSSAFIGFYNLCSWRKDHKFLTELEPIVKCDNIAMKKKIMKALLETHNDKNAIQMGRSLDHFLKLYLTSNTNYKQKKDRIEQHFLINYK